MKRFLFLFIIVLTVFSCKKDCSIEIIPEEDVALTVKAFYDSEWGGIKEQILDCIEIYECLTEPSCTVPEEYMDTVYYVFESGNISHEKKIKYDWEFLESENPNVTILEVSLGDMSFGEFESLDFSYEYRMIYFSIIIEDDVQKDYYRVGLKNNTFGDYVNTEFDEFLKSCNECSLRIHKSNYEIQAHFCLENINIYHNNSCTPHETIPPTKYSIQYFVE